MWFIITWGWRLLLLVAVFAVIALIVFAVDAYPQIGWPLAIVAIIWWLERSFSK